MIRAAAGMVFAALALLSAAPGDVRASHVTFGEPEAIARLGQPVVFETTLEAAGEPQNVEVLVNLPSDPAATVLGADVINDGGTWRAAAVLEGEIAPNTRLSFRFRAREDDDVVLGPVAETVVVDDRFAWRTISGPIVRLHWYEGDEQFAQRALDIGEGAIERASQLLGVSETEPVDFFIYSNEADFREALGPGTRENVGGQAHSDIRTLFGLIEPQEIGSDWVDTLVIHELTHLVFDTATDNVYRAPPRWLNEGVAVYLSEGYTGGSRAAVEQAAADGSLIPLEGLAGLFPTTADRFFLAYAESVSAVDFFIDNYEEQTLWDLVRSYADGVSDEEAFRQATGAGLAEFNEAWMASLGAEVPEPAGPRPGQPGPLPPGWDPGAEPAPGPTDSPLPGASVGPATPAPSGTGRVPPRSPPAADDGNFTLGLVLAVVVVVAIIGFAILAQRRGTAGPPPT
ncbi:MAG TPA: peptidase MA family metallohydrolase [Candidatus Caenarcaniphilales bacterium]|nr:peptidase MA family metallohydrolase [Candidatus Caenarcaniphilales bacterium]